MQGTNRTIARLITIVALLGLTVAIVAPASSAAVTSKAPTIEGARTSLTPEETNGRSIAVAPDGTPWLGIAASRVGPMLGRLRPSGRVIEMAVGRGSSGSTSALRFDAAGNLWFVRKDPSGTAILRRSPSGATLTTRLPRGGIVNGLAPDAEGGTWFVRGYRESAAIGRVTAAGKVTTTPLARGSLPSSVVVGPDGAAWFTEQRGSEIGRITSGGELRLFTLERGADPRQIVVGSDGALWFSERGRALGAGKFEDRIGRITTVGQGSEFPIPFGTGTVSLAPTPQGPIWFSTEKGELSSISTSGIVGGRGCYVAGCVSKIVDLALAPDGGVWFTATKEPCTGCGGGSALIHENMGSPFGEIPAGALEPAIGASP